MSSLWWQQGVLTPWWQHGHKKKVFFLAQTLGSMVAEWEHNKPRPNGMGEMGQKAEQTVWTVDGTAGGGMGGWVVSEFIC